jgi:hypothetical protein
MSCTNRYHFPTFDDVQEASGTLANTAPLPPVVDCAGFGNTCESILPRCPHDIPYYHPVLPTDVLTLQTRFRDPLNYRNLLRSKNCPHYLDLDKRNFEYVSFDHVPQYEWGCDVDVTFEFWVTIKSFGPGWVTLMAKQRPNSAPIPTSAQQSNWPAIFLWAQPSGALNAFFGYRPDEQTHAQTQAGLVKEDECAHIVFVRPARMFRANQWLLYVNGNLATWTILDDTMTSGQCSLHRRLSPNPPYSPLSYDAFGNVTTNPADTPWVNDGPITLGMDLDCDVPRSYHWTPFKNMESGDLKLYSFRIYNRGLDSTEVMANYQKGLSDCIPDAVTNVSALVLNATFNQLSGYRALDSSPVGNHGQLIPYGTYNIPFNSQLSCDFRIPRNFGYRPERVAEGGGAWLKHQESDCGCCPEVPCFGLAAGVDCAIPAGFARLRFQLPNTPSLVYGAAAQAASNHSDAAFVLRYQSQACPLPTSSIDPLLRLSNANSRSEYLNNVRTYFDNTLLGTSTVTLNASTGEYELLLDQAAYRQAGQDVCQPQKLCPISYPVADRCTPATSTVFAFRVLSVGGTGSVPFRLQAPGCTGFTVSANVSSLSAFITSLVNNFNATALGNSQAEAFFAVGDVSSPTGVRFILDNAHYQSLCDCWDTVMPTVEAPATLSAQIVERPTDCCARPCVENEQGYVSMDFWVPDAVNYWSSSSTVAVNLSCGAWNLNMGAWTLAPAANQADWIAAFVARFNRQGNGLYAMPFADYLRIKIPAGLLGPCDCQDMNGQINVNAGAVLMRPLARHCCQSTCANPPEYARIEFDLFNNPNYVFNNPNNFSWLVWAGVNQNCANACNTRPVTTAQFTNFGDYARAAYADLLAQLAQYGGGSTLWLEEVNPDRFRIRGYLNPAVLPWDVCARQLQVCSCSNYSPVQCLCNGGEMGGIYTFGNSAIQSNITGFTVGCQFYNLPQPIFWSGSGASAANQLCTAILSPAFQALYPGTNCTVSGNAILICVPINSECCNPPLPLTISGSFMGGSYPNGQPITCCQPVGQPFNLQTTPIQFGNCCSICPNPFGYVTIEYHIKSTAISTIRIICRETGAEVLNLSLGIIATSIARAAARAAERINTLHSGQVIAVATGNMLRLYLPYTDRCACNLEPSITPTVNETSGLYCCASTLRIPGVSQTVPAIILQNATCCPEHLLGIELYDCCCQRLNLPGFDLRSAVECWGVGFDVDPLRFYQNVRIRVADIPVDCFSLRFTAPGGQQYYTECYRKVACESTVELCSDYPEDATDCSGAIYGIPEYFCTADNCDFPPYRNCIRIPGELLLSEVQFETDILTKTSRQLFRLRTPPLPESVIVRLQAILNGHPVRVNGQEMTYEGSITQNLEASTMWALDMRFSAGEDCRFDHGCAVEGA